MTQIACRSNRKWVGMLQDRQANGAGWPPGPSELAALAAAAAADAGRVSSSAAWRVLSAAGSPAARRACSSPRR